LSPCWTRVGRVLDACWTMLDALCMSGRGAWHCVALANGPHHEDLAPRRPRHFVATRTRKRASTIRTDALYPGVPIRASYVLANSNPEHPGRAPTGLREGLKRASTRCHSTTAQLAVNRQRVLHATPMLPARWSACVLEGARAVVCQGGRASSR